MVDIVKKPCSECKRVGPLYRLREFIKFQDGSYGLICRSCWERLGYSVSMACKWEDCF